MAYQGGPYGTGTNRPRRRRRPARRHVAPVRRVARTPYGGTVRTRPSVGGPRGSGSLAPQRKQHRRQVRRINRAVRRAQPKPQNVFGTPIGKQTPQRRLRQKARQHGREAQRQARRLPRQPVPYIPLKKQYTPAERRAATRIYRQGVTRTAKRVGLTPRQVSDSLQSDVDPRTRQRLRPYVRATRQGLEARHAAIALSLAAPGHKQREYQRAVERINPRDRKQLARTWQEVDPYRGDRISAARPERQVLGVSGSDVSRFNKQKNFIYVAGAGINKNAPPQIQDIIDLPANVVAGAYYTGRAGVKAAQGDSSEARQMWRDFKNTSPVALAVQGRFKEAGQNFVQRPFTSTLEVTGYGSIPGRAAGFGARSGAFGASAARAGSRRRVPARLVGTNIEQRRFYSKNIATKAGQVALERRQIRKAAGYRAQATKERAAGRHKAAQRLERKANTVDPHIVDPQSFKGGREVRRRVDERQAANEDVRRGNRAEIIERAAAALASQQPKRGRVVEKRRAKVAEEVQTLVAQGITKADSRDLAKYRAELDHEFVHGDLSPAQLHANEQLRAQIGKVLARKNVDYPALKRAADDYAAVVNPLARELDEAGMLPKARADKARLIPYAVRNMGARHDGQRIVLPLRVPPDPKAIQAAERQVARVAAEVEQLRSWARPIKVAQAEERLGKAQAQLDSIRRGEETSRPLTTAEIEQHMRNNGLDPEKVAFITQAPNQRGARNFFVNSNEPVKVGGMARTGEATRQGTFDADPQVLIEQAARTQGLVDANRGFNDFYDEFGLKDNNGIPITATRRTDIQNRIDDLAASTGRELQAIRLNPWGGRESQLEKLIDDASTDSPNVTLGEDGHNPVVDAIESALKGEGDEFGPWGIVDKTAANRMFQHQRILGAGGGGKVAQQVNSAFRQTVLSTSPKWFTGNIVEAALRLTLARAGPRSYITGRKVLKNAGPEAQARVVGGGHYSMAERQHVHRSAEQYADTALAPVARALGSFWRAPGGKQLSKVWQRWTHLVFRQTNGRLEQQFQTALAGRYVRDFLMDGQQVKTFGRAIEQATKGMKNTNDQVAAGRWLDRAYGKYSKFSPGERRTIALYTPFVAWSLNAAKFVFSVLPRDHPVVTALLASSHTVSEEWRREHGLDKFMGEGAVPPFLQGSIPVSGGGKLRLSRYTPFGAFTDPGDTIASSVLPQYGSMLNALQGKDWKGDDIHIDGREPNDVEKFKLAIVAFAEATVPVYGLASGIAKGDKSARQRWDPFYPTYPSTKKKGGRKKSSGNPWLSPSGGSSSASPSGGSSNPWLTPAK